MSKPEECECNEPDGGCEGCNDEHGHTCIYCDEEWCQSCWTSSVHTEPCLKKLLKVVEE